MKKATFFILMILFSSIVLAVNCQDITPIKDIPCTAVTPVIDCDDFTVNVTFLGDNSSDLINTTPVGDGTHQWEFNYTTLGQYSLVACDNSTVVLQLNPNFTSEENFLWLYVFLIGGGIVLLIVWKMVSEIWFTVLAGFLFTIAGITFLIWGFPGFENEFLKVTVGIIITMLGLYFVVGPLIEYLEDKF